jgi:hypothetical protein
MSNTIENNKLIAEFMGYEKIVFPENSKYLGQYTNPISKRVYSISELEYHSDWNWLMEVLSKIKKMGYFVDMNYLSNTYGHIATSHYSDKTIIAEISHKPNPSVSKPPTAENPIYINEYDEPKEALYNLIVRFINWYNQQSK